MAQFDAFISYARSASTLEAQRLQTAIQTFAKPWYRLRAVRIFRDDSSMSANPALWSSIEQGLVQARWLVVLLSQAAARSEYVAAEIRWWLQHKDASTILLVHDDGVLAWDRQRNDFTAATDCVPAPLRGAFREEPRWTDLSWFDDAGSSGAADPRFTEKVADLAAAIRGIPRDELVGDDVAQHKRAWRLARVAIGALSLLLIASVVASIIAIAQRNEVQRQATTLLARQLAATADSLLTRDLRRAQLLAVQAYRTEPNPDARAALLRATLASPALRRFVPFPATISAVNASTDGRFVAAGLENGEVYSWDVATASPVQRLRLSQSVQDVGVSDDGGVIAAVDGTTTQVATAAGTGALVVPAGERPQTVAVSPSGTGVVIGSQGVDVSHLTLADLDARTQRSVVDPLTTENSNFGAYSLLFVGDDRLVVIGNTIETRTYPGFVKVNRGEFSYGARQPPGRVSNDGRFTTAVNGDPEVPVWPVDGDQDKPPRYAYAPMTDASAVALNHDATRLVVADAAGLHLADVRSTTASTGYGHSAAAPVDFVGIPDVNLGGVLFLGTTNRFVVATGSELSLWDPDSAGRSAATAELALGTSCTACGSPAVVLSPDGSTMALRDGNRFELMVRSVPGRSGATSVTYHPQAAVGELAPPVWLNDSSVLQLSPGADGGTLSGPLPELPQGVTGWALGTPDDRVLTVRLSADGGTVGVVNASGRIASYQRDGGGVTGESAIGTGEGGFFDAALSEDLGRTALIGDAFATQGVIVRNTGTGETEYTLAEQGDTASRALFADGSLWIRYNSGLVERRDPATGELQRRLPGRFTGNGPFTEGAGLVAIPSDLGAVLYDASTDALLGTVPLPANGGSVRRGIGLAPDGSVLVSAYEPLQYEGKGLAVTTQLAPEDLVRVACRTSGGSLTADDWQVLVGTTPPADLTCR